MRGVAYALMASSALSIGELTSASAGCYGECNGYQEGGYRGQPSYQNYSDRPVYREPSSYSYSEGSRYYGDGPRYQTTYEGTRYQTT